MTEAQATAHWDWCDKVVENAKAVPQDPDRGAHSKQAMQSAMVACQQEMKYLEDRAVRRAQAFLQGHE